MSWFSELFGAEDLVKAVGNIVDDVYTSDEEEKEIELKKEELKIELQKLIEQRMSEKEQTSRKILEAKQQVVVAELKQDDNYTKRARPTIAYFGMFMIAANYFIIPFVMYLSGKAPEPFLLPTEFWASWGGVVAAWTFGRSVEKNGNSNKLTRAITGSKKIPSLLDD